MKISYIIHHGYAERSSFRDDGGDVLSLVFSPSCSGALTLGASVFTVVDGHAEIPIKEIKDGECCPRLESDLGAYDCEAFKKHGSCITILQTGDEIVRRLIERCRLLEKSRDLIEQRVTRLESLCSGHQIFNFERNEK